MSAVVFTMPAPDVERRCVYCDGAVDAWRPFHIRAADLSVFLHRVDVVGSNVERYGCPSCQSNDRERHLLLYFERLDLAACVRDRVVLHMCPERRFAPYVRDHAPRVYRQGELGGPHAGVPRMDLQHLPFRDATFDLVIANHVLEHVADVGLALAEVHRVLVPGGRFICQTPFARRLTHTLAEPHLQTPEDRRFFYGQEDHLRLFVTDVELALRHAGFEGGLRPHASVLADVDPEVMGVNEHEPFFDFVRPMSPEAHPR